MLEVTTDQSFFLGCVALSVCFNFDSQRGESDASDNKNDQSVTTVFS